MMQRRRFNPPEPLVEGIFPLEVHFSDKVHSAELPSFYQVGWSANFFSSPVYRKVNGEECLPLVSVSKGCTSLL